MNKLIFVLSKSAKLNWGLKYAALKTIYTVAILPLLLYGAPVWKKAIDKASYKLKAIRVGERGVALVIFLLHSFTVVSNINIKRTILK